MKVQTPQIGGIAISIRGRDCGKAYVISETSGNRISVVDGTARKLTNPKTKNIKHVRLLPLSVSFEKDGAYDNRVARYLKGCGKSN